MADGLNFGNPSGYTSDGVKSPLAGAYESKMGTSLPPRDIGGRFRLRNNAGATLMWLGDEVLAENLERATVAVKAATEFAKEHAKENHPWQNQTGNLEAGIFSNEPVVDGTKVAGSFGAPSPALFMEFGTVHIPNAFPFLYPAQDAAAAMLRETL
jgi:hypothetical protein